MKKYLFWLPLLLSFLLLTCRSKESGEKAPENLESITRAETSAVQAKGDSMNLEETAIQEEAIQVVEMEDRYYTVQVSSWRTRKYAERDAQRFINRGYDAYIQRAYLYDRNETWYRVRIGRFKTKEECLQLVDQLYQLLESGYWLDRYRAEK